MKMHAIKQQWDRALALLAAAVGALALVLGWVGVSDVALVTQQIPYLISGAVVGLVAFGVASTLWISADLRDEWAKLNDIYLAVADQPAAADEGAAAVDLTQERATVGGRGR